MNGDLDEIIDSLIAADQAAKLSSMQKKHNNKRCESTIGLQDRLLIE